MHKTLHPGRTRSSSLENGKFVFRRAGGVDLAGAWVQNADLRREPSFTIAPVVPDFLMVERHAKRTGSPAMSGGSLKMPISRQ